MSMKINADPKKSRAIFNSEAPLQPLSLQQNTQKYSSLDVSQWSSPRPRLTISSAKPHGPNPHSFFITKPFVPGNKVKQFKEYIYILM